MSGTEAAHPIFELHAPFGWFVQAPPTAPLGDQTSHVAEASHHSAVRTELTKMEQIIEYLKVLYR
jgi:hypothetical protein